VFAGGEKEPVETRVMIFCQYRDSVREITELLQNHRPLIRPMQFVGHASSTSGKDGSPASNNKTNRRFTQKDQLMVRIAPLFMMPRLLELLAVLQVFRCELYSMWFASRGTLGMWFCC